MCVYDFFFFCHTQLEETTPKGKRLCNKHLLSSRFTDCFKIILP